MLNERIEEDDLRELRNTMDNRLKEFKDEWNELKMLSLQTENEQEQIVYLIKNEVLDIADRFDQMQEVLLKQTQMIEYLVQRD